jgi:hypothetical protein
MLIFDRFEDIGNARRFAKAATKLSGLRSLVCRNYEEFDQHELYPFVVRFPAALVGRADMTDEGFKTEGELIALVPSFGGHFSGT